MPTKTFRAAATCLALAASTAILAAQPALARSGAPARCQAHGDGSAFALATRVLTGPDGGQLTVRVSPLLDACGVPDTFKKIQVKSGGSAERKFKDVAAPGGVATVDLGTVARGQRLEVQVLVQDVGDEQRTYELSGSTIALLRPDLVVTAVSAPRQILSGRAFTVSAEVAERNGDVSATATLTLTAGSTILGTTSIELAAGASATKTFDVTLPNPGTVALDATISAAAPSETSTANNGGRATVEVTEFQVDKAQVLVPEIAGYGGQFNGRVYAKISRDAGVTPENVLELEPKMLALEPQLSRIFINAGDLTDPDRLASFVRTAVLAQRAGSTINVTWQSGTLDVKTGNLPKLAAVLNDLVKNRGVTNLRWVTIQNEPNSTRITLAQYEAQYRALDPLILDIRGQVRFMGGDLVRNGSIAGLDQQGQRVWFDYMATHMADILDAWSIHVFWDYWDTSKLQERLSEVRTIWDGEPASGRKPLYVTEYGVRGLQTFNGIAQFQPGVWSDGTPMTRTNVNAFQHAWFDILSARLGYLGTIKWDSYFGKYDNGTQAFYMIGRPQEGWPLYPVYHTLRLWTMSVKRGWKVVGLDGGSGSKLLTAYAGPAGELTVLGLDTAGASLNAVSPVQVDYSIGGLPPLETFHVAVWNQTGDGQNVVVGDVVADPAGVAVVTVPLHAVFTLTTLPLGGGAG